MQLNELITELNKIIDKYPGSELLPVKFTYINDSKSKQSIRVEDIINVSPIASINGLEYIELQEARADLLYNYEDEEYDEI